MGGTCFLFVGFKMLNLLAPVFGYYSRGCYLYRFKHTSSLYDYTLIKLTGHSRRDSRRKRECKW